MANLIASATGFDKHRRKATHRLGSEAAEVEAATWRTFARVEMNKDGSGRFRLQRDDKTLYEYSWSKEEE